MKLKDHVLKEGRTIQVVRKNKRYVCRILQKGTSHYWIIAKRYGATKAFYMDFTRMIYIRASRRWIVDGYQPPFQGRRWFEFDTFEEAIQWLKENDFKILPNIHRSRRRRRF